MTNQLAKDFPATPADKMLAVISKLEFMINRENGVKDTMMNRAKKLLESGAIDLDKYPEDNYKLPRILLNASLEYALDQYELTGSNEKKELKNLRKF